ncbi:unnamed protein product [Dovyalis caffra]|uniref:Uncharacterized protein n=1 Tax=Dovyalis caffra TaxID=77055 RepID=A0AAV1RUT0_9ROSI|nr:unnamed protein product [Dovyalis caffra]
MGSVENGSTRYRAPHPHLVNGLKQRRSGYEPSDTETDWQDSPMVDQKNGAFGPESPIQLVLPRNISPLKNSWRHSSRFDDNSPKKDSVNSPLRRRHSSKSPFKPRRDDGGAEPIPNQRNTVPLLRPESRRQISPFRAQRDESGAGSPTLSQRNLDNSLESESGRQVSPYRAQREDGGIVSPKSSQRHVSPLSKPDQRRQVSPYKAQREGRAVSPKSSRRNVSPLSKPDQRRQLSPYKAQRQDGGAVSPKSSERNVSPLSKPDKGRHISPYKSGRKEHVMHENGEIVSSNRRKNQRTPTGEERSTHAQFGKDGRLSERLNVSRRMAAAPRQRSWDKEQENSQGHKDQKGEEAHHLCQEA